jgi:acetyl esterase/lipase
MFAVVDYAADTSNLNYIDKSRIGATGHSAGGNAAIRGANFFGKEAQRSGKPSKLHSVFISGYVLTRRRLTRLSISRRFSLWTVGSQAATRSGTGRNCLASFH